MSIIKKRWLDFVRIIVPPDSDIRVGAFNILAICGIIVSIITGFYNLSVGFGIISFLECMMGVPISLALMYYIRKTGNHRGAMILTVIIIFLGLFTFLYITNGGYYGGVPYFFIFAAVFTAFLLDGIIMPVFVAIELVWYGILCWYTYKFPPETFLAAEENVRAMDIVVCESIVSISLAITMYLQIRVYRRKQVQLNEAIKAAEEANMAKSDFLAKMSHDIRTPLNTIMAMNDMIVSNTSSAKIREWVNDSNVSGQILLSMIDDMLDITKIEAGRMEILEQPWDTQELFDEIYKAWKVQADKIGVVFNYLRDVNIPDFLIGDEDIIRKVTNNLVSNAVKYTRSGRIELEVKMDARYLLIVVRDTGIGIAPEHLENIFKPFDRGAQDAYRETSGSGLGLAIVKELVDAANGTINCTSIVGEGTTFSVRIPQRETNTEKILRTGKPLKDDKEQAKEKFIAPDARILVVDDNPSNRKVIDVFLEETLIQIDDVESGYEALEMLDIREYDLVLMDLRMPRMDGEETLRKIKSEYPDFDTPVIVLTADIMNGVKERLLDSGFVDFLAKPFSSALLYETIRKYISADKIIPIEKEKGDELTFSRVENFQDLLMPYGIDLKLALENNAGSTEELLMRAKLFDEYADENLEKLGTSDYDDNYYLQVHSVKSVANGVGAYFLSQLAQTAEIRRDDDYSSRINPVLIEEYKRVREGLEKLGSEVEAL